MKKKQFWQGFAGGIAATVALCIIVSLGVSVFTAGGKKSSGTSKETGLDTAYIKEKISVIEDILQDSFLYDIDPETVEDWIYRGMIYGLEDRYAAYYTEEEYKQVQKSQSGSYCGIGASVTQDMETGAVTFVEIYPDSPAEKAGLLAGDVLQKVDDTEVTGMDLELISSQYIGGEEGTELRLTVLRGDEVKEFTVVRGQIEIQSVAYELLEDGVGYISITQFDKETTNQFSEAVEALENQGMERLLIDLRDNSGGVLNSAVDIAAYLLPDDQFDGTIVYTENKDGEGERYYSQDGMIQYESDTGNGNSHYPKEDGHQLDIPIVVLINENSASASELLTGCLKDYGWATVVGTTSFGKGIVQIMYPLEDGSAVKMTASQYFTPSGYALHGKGIDPDVVAEQDPESEEDTQLEEALSVLKGMTS